VFGEQLVSRLGEKLLSTSGQSSHTVEPQFACHDRERIPVQLVHLTSSTFFGGPERQMLGLAKALPHSVRTQFVSFPEHGRCTAFLNEARRQGFAALALQADFPRVFAAVDELTGVLRQTGCSVLLTHGYKANLLGRVAARRAGVPVVGVSRGWTGENRRVRLYEWLDRRHLRLLDHVVCVSAGQADKVQRWCGVPPHRLSVIRNSARLAAFELTDPTARQRLQAFFPPQQPVTHIVLAAGRLSPEKGFDVLVEAAATICRENATAGVVLFGEGVLRPQLERRIAELGLADRFVLPGFRTDLDALIGAADVVVLPSFTEGLPNVALEASAAGVPVVATAVGGTPEVVADGQTGFLVPPGAADQLAARVGQLLREDSLRTQLGQAGQHRMRSEFTFAAQAEAYLQLIESLLATRGPVPRQRRWHPQAVLD
jgi:glycosyltransferase involved in cell wall biosynthesis